MGRPNVNWNVGGKTDDYQCKYKTVSLKGSLPFTSQVVEADTKYVIKWDFDLEGATISMPDRCILAFEGGSIDNGTIIGNDTVIINESKSQVFGNGITKAGTWVGDENVQITWEMLHHGTNNTDNSIDYNQQNAYSDSWSLVGIDKLYFEQTVKDLQPATGKSYILAVKFQWYNYNGSYVRTDSYTRLNVADAYWDIPEEAINGYVNFSIRIDNYNAALYKKVIDAAKIYTNAIRVEEAAIRQIPAYEDNNEKYKNRLYRRDITISSFGYSQWRITDSSEHGTNSIWETQVAGNWAECIIDLGEFTERGYNAIVVTGDDTYKSWFTFVKKYPTVRKEVVEQSFVYGEEKFIHSYVYPKTELLRIIPSDAKYLVVSWRHGESPISYYHPKSVKFIQTDINAGGLSEAFVKNSTFTNTLYKGLTYYENKNVNTNKVKICHWNLGHFSKGTKQYSTITEEEESAARSSFISMFNTIKADVLLFNEYSHKFSPSYNFPSLIDYTIEHEGRTDNFCCNSIFSNRWIQLIGVIYFPYSTYLVDGSYTDANDYASVYRTYIYGHAITIVSLHLRSGNSVINETQCEYLITQMRGYSNVLMVGDFNRITANMSIFEDAGYTVKITEPTYQGGSSLDHFVYKGYVKIVNEAVISTELSDHYPIVATLTTTDAKEISGTTSSRPTNVNTGFQYFDTTLGKPIYYNGTNWVDATGTTV